MAVVMLEEAKQYLRVDSADEDAFISGLLETGSVCARIWCGWKWEDWKVIFPW